MIATLSGADPAFPADCWDLSSEQIILALNLSRESRCQSVSSRMQVCGALDFNKTPSAPAGCEVVAHDRPHERGTWQDHGTEGFCIGPAETKANSASAGMLAGTTQLTAQLSTIQASIIAIGDQL